MNEEEVIEGEQPENGGTPSEVVNEEPTEEKVSLTKTELAALMRETVTEAMQGFQKESPKVEPPATAYDPVTESYNYVRQGTRMAAEALSLYPDLPAKYKDLIQDKLDLIPPDQIGNFRTNNLHKTIARDIAMTAIEDGEYIHSRSRPKDTPRVEPIGGSGGGPGFSQGGVDKAKADEINELYAFLGLSKPTDAKLKQAANEPSNSGYRS